MSKKITALEFIKILGTNLGESKRKTRLILEKLSESLVQQLQLGYNVTLPKIGIVKLRDTASGVINNNLTGYKDIPYAAKRTAILKVDKALKGMLN